MRSIKFIPLVLALALPLLSVRTASAQSIGDADVQRLQDSIYDVSRDVVQARDRDPRLAAQLQVELDGARDEVASLRVKLQRRQPIAAREYADVQRRIDDIGSRAYGDRGRRGSPPARSGFPDRNRGFVSQRDSGPDFSTDDVPAGTEIDLRLSTPLDSNTASAEDRVEATTAVDLMDGSTVLVPAGSVVRGMVSTVNRAGRVDRTGKMTVVFDRITIDGRSYPIQATVTQAIRSEGIGAEKEKIAIGAGIGAIVGGILGGVKGAVVGVLIGGGGMIAATEGQEVELPAGTILTLRLDSGLNLR